MSYDTHDTISAIATAAGGATRGIVRVSGPAAHEIAAQCFFAVDGESLHSLQRFSATTGEIEICLDAISNPSLSLRERAGVRATRDEAIHPHPTLSQRERVSQPVSEGATLQRLPCDLFVWPADASYTREPIAEFHTIGSPPLVQAVLETVCRAGARLAEPGEFTLRAFLAGRLDLTQAEAVLGVVDARHSDELHVAVEQMAGGLSRPLHRLRDELLELLAEVEAGLDFVEDDLEFISRSELLARLENAAAEIEGIANQMQSRLAANGLPQVALVGPPNAGKSSLFNALAQSRPVPLAMSEWRPASNSALAKPVAPDCQPFPPAIVSDQRGTTRDYLTTVIGLGPIRCELVDTAGVDDFGLRHPEGTPDRGLEESYQLTDNERQTSVASTARAMSAAQIRRAALIAYCVETIGACKSGESKTPSPCPLPEGEGFTVDIIVLTKADLVPQRAGAKSAFANIPVVVTSSVTGQGLDELTRTIALLIERRAADDTGSCVAATANRCRDSLRLAHDAVQRAAESASSQRGDELIAAELRVALAELGKVVGSVYTDDILDRIFSSFCIGK